MMARFGALAAGLLMLAACAQDETVAAYGGAERTWQLESIDGAPYAASATMEFGPRGGVNGAAPCNSYAAVVSAPYPWFALGPMAVSRRACPDLDAETAFFAALSEMSQAEVSGDVLVLSNDAGRSMAFRALAPQE